MTANSNSTFCTDSRCINYFENMCMKSLIEIETNPVVDYWTIGNKCKEFKRGSYIAYVADISEVKENL